MKHQPTILLGITAEAARLEIEAMLRNEGYKVISARDGYHLIESIAGAILDDSDSARPDLIIAEAIMFGCTGLSLLTGLRDLHWTIPMILLATAGDDQVRRRAEPYGITTAARNAADFEALRQLTNELLRGGLIRSAEATPRRNAHISLTTS